MSSEKLAELMNDARVINVSEHLIFPMIEKMVSVRLDWACAKFRQGEKDLLSEIAYITALKDIETDLKARKLRGQQAFEKLNKE